MPLSLLTKKRHDHVQIQDKVNATESAARVNSNGQIDVKFHSNPTQLAEYFERFEEAFAQRPERRPKQKHKFEDPERPESTPRLCIAIHIVGSRGDVQPFIPIAQLLIGYGHRVRICTHLNFKSFVESNGVEFFSIGGDPEALMSYMVRNPGLLPSKESIKAGEIGKRKREMAEILEGAWRSCIEAGDGTTRTRLVASHVKDVKDLFVADAIIANPPSMAHIHCAEKLNIPLHMVFTMPWSPTKVFHHPLAAMEYDEADHSVANYMSFMLMELLTWEGLGDIINDFRRKTLKLDPISPMWGYQLLPRMRVPYTYLWSQTLIAKPYDWDDHIKITGFSFLEQASTYTPPQDLVDFLKEGPTPIYIGFGSIVIDDPEALTQLLLEAVKLAGVRAIVSKGWGGVGSGDIPKNIYLIGNCPHDWLFKQVSAVVHHGGAGTTAAGIALGRPTVVVPFFGDQQFWGQMIAKAGAGPAPVPFKKMTAESLAESITYALKPEVKKAVQAMADQIASENGARDTATDINERLDVSDFRCDLFPDKLAVWLHKKTGSQLSGMAASSLIQNHVIKYNELKVLKRRHWYVDEGAEHPIIGIIATGTNFIRAIDGAVTHFKRRAIRPELVTNDLEKSKIRKASVVQIEPEEWQAGEEITNRQIEQLARRIARKTRRERAYDSIRAKIDENLAEDRHKPTVPFYKEEKPHSRPVEVTIATGELVGELTLAVISIPMWLMYNLANGFHNIPSYSLWSVPVRRRDEITGLGTGLRTAGKEFILGHWDALRGLVVWPYRGAKQGGAKGFGKGVFQAWRGFSTNIGAAVFGLYGYSTKGLYEEVRKRQLTSIKAEIALIRLRQSVEDYKAASEEEKLTAVKRWKSLQCMA
ncbi:uncharacterized protein PV09_06683 [Verruconis gallopava]|uniref:Uncharacterized protein n=1 Tax=Verruconis gallopava TaxID=253628 RepID=A0A0D1YLX9_9PEZI|nr:uncharacterized protein PV09_06683 [Verruconis gallopava]KIW01832.1 hypothetical protein PV09_06683 [Verruconis gallopava]